MTAQRLQKVDELTTPCEVGRFYLVPCVDFMLHGERRVWPVIGAVHTDADHLNFPDRHYHFDYRFMSASGFAWMFSARDWASPSFYSAEEAIYGRVLPEFHNAEPTDPVLPDAPTYRRMRCKRQFPFSTVGRHGRFAALHTAFAGRAAIRTEKGFVCPHRLAPLGSLLPDDQGVVQCPLHGLRFNANTGEAVAQPPCALLNDVAAFNFIRSEGHVPNEILLEGRLGQ